MKFNLNTKCLVLFFLLLSSSQILLSQTITLGSGTTTNDITTSSPINIYFRKTVCQIVYTAAELTAAGATAGPITELGFYVTNNPVYAIPNYEINMKHTNATNASGALGGGFTTIKTIGSYAPTAGGWDMLVLDTPFEWNGTQNIAIRICWSQVYPSYDPSGQLRVYNATNGYKSRRSDAGGSACGLNPNATLNTKPQIRFIFHAETVWTGTISTNWMNPGNWTAGVPTSNIDANIPAGTPFSPTLNGNGACKLLTLNGSLTLGSLGTLSIYENFINSGIFHDLGGFTNFTGTSSHEISTTDELTIENLRSNSSAGLTITSGTVIIGTELQVNKGIFNTGDALILRSDAHNTARIDELSTTCTYTLSMTDSWEDGWNGGFITLLEDGVTIETFACIGAATTETFQINAGSEFVINYTAGTYEGENTYSLLNEDGVVIFSDGSTPSTGDVYSEIASGCSYASTLVGNITMERYIDAGETNWRYFASAVENPTISQYLDDFTTAGFPGSPFPDFPFISIYSYDETLEPGLGYVACAGTEEVITVGKGYQVWSGDTITGTDPFLVDLVGPANQGDIDLPVTFTPSDSPSEDGWCLIGNPYASTIDWDSPNWTKTNIASATYIQDPDTELYATYVAGAGANGGSRYIASQQSFWIHATASSPVLTAHENVKSNVDADFFKAAEEFSPGMTIQLKDGDFKDEAVVRHIDGASDEFEPAYDAEKMFGGWGIHPQLSLVNTDDVDLTVHSFHQLGAEFSIPVRVVVFETGDYQLRFLNTGEIDAPCMKLEDTYTGIIYPIEEGADLTFTLYDTTYAPRFLLHIGRTFEQSTLNVACYGESNGQFNLDLAVDGYFDFELFSDGFYQSDSALFNPFTTTALPEGVYSLIVNDFYNICQVDTFTFTIHQPAPLELEAELFPVSFGADGSIHVWVLGGTAPYALNWSTGDDVNLIEGLSEGEYELLITDAHSCYLDSTFYLNSLVELSETDQRSVMSWYYNSDLHQINIFESQLDMDAQAVLYTIHGQLITTLRAIQTDSGLYFQLPLDLPVGIYFIREEQENSFYRFSY